MKKFITLAVSLAMILAVVLTQYGASFLGISDSLGGRGSGKDQSITSKDEALDMMNVATYFFSSFLNSDLPYSTAESNALHGTSTTLSLNTDSIVLPTLLQKARSTFLDSDIPYSGMTIYETITRHDNVSNGNNRYSAYMLGDAIIYLTTDAAYIDIDATVSIMLQEEIVTDSWDNSKTVQAQSTAFSIGYQMYIDKECICFKIDYLDMATADMSTLTSLLGKWIDFSGNIAGVDEVISLVRTLYLEALSNSLQYQSDFFAENQDTAFVKNGSVYSVKDSEFKEFMIGDPTNDLSGVYGDIIEIIDMEKLDTLEGDFSIDLSNKTKPKIFKTAKGSLKDTIGECNWDITVELSFENIDNTVIKQPSKIWSIEEIEKEIMGY